MCVICLVTSVCFLFGCVCRERREGGVDLDRASWVCKVGSLAGYQVCEAFLYSSFVLERFLREIENGWARKWMRSYHFERERR